MSYSQIIADKISKMLEEAESLCDSGEPSKAITKLTRAIALQNRNPDLFEKRAEAYILVKNFELAIANFQKALALREEDSVMVERLGVVHCQYGEALFGEGRYSQALMIYEQAAQYRPEDKEVVMKRISCLLALERFSECVEMIKQELECDDSNPELYVLRARLKLLFGDTSAAYYDICCTLDLDPSHTQALAMKAELEETAQQCKNQAVHHSLVGRKLDALKKITTAIETDPAVAEYHLFRGALYRRLKDFEASVDDFLTAMDKVNHHQGSDVYRNASRQLVLTYNDFAMECFRQRHFNEAVVLLNKAIKEEKTERGLYLNRGDCFYRLNSLHFALTDYQQALEMDPSDWEVSCRIGIVYSELGVVSYSKECFTESEAHFTSAITHNPKVSRFYTCRAKARLMRKNLGGAREDLLAALTLDPNNQECISLIARAFPGKSKDELLTSKEAEQRRERLEREIRQLATHNHTGSIDYSTNRTLTGLLGDLNLKFEGSSESDSTPSQAGDLRPQSRVTLFVPTPSQSEAVVDVQTESAEPQPALESGALSMATSHKDGGDEPTPRNWCVLSHPLPELTSDPQGVMPLLKDCLQEHSFHKKIYYSKRNITEEVQRVLKSPPQLSQSVRLEKSTSADKVTRTKATSSV